MGKEKRTMNGIEQIREKYIDPRTKSWDEKDKESLDEEALKKEKTIEEIIRILMAGTYTVSDCREIIKKAWERISLTTPVGVAIRYPKDLLYQESTLEDNEKNSQTNIPQKNL